MRKPNHKVSLLSVQSKQNYHFKFLHKSREYDNLIFDVLTFQAHSEEAWASQHVWDLGMSFEISLWLNKINYLFSSNKTEIPHPPFFLRSQEDDIDGEHIVAFAEEDDPGEYLS